MKWNWQSCRVEKWACKDVSKHDMSARRTSQNKGWWAGFILHLPGKLYCCLEKHSKGDALVKPAGGVHGYSSCNMMYVSNLACNSLEKNSEGFKERHSIFGSTTYI